MTATLPRTFDAAAARRCRQEFPSLDRPRDGREQVYFDGPAGTQVPLRVADAVRDCMLWTNANKGGAFASSREVDRLLDRALAALAGFLGAEDPREIVFGPNMTSLAFPLARALAQEWKPGDRILVTATDHDANVAPWLLAAEEAGAEVVCIPWAEDTWLVDLDELHRQLDDRTRIVAVCCACNATGGINPFRQIIADAHRAGAEVFLDAVHYAPHGLIDVRQWGCDWLACSAYKFFGPHAGILWGRAARLETLRPAKVRPSSNAIPWRWTAGTPCIETIAGAAEAVEYLADLGRDLAADAGLPLRAAVESAMEGIARYESELGWQLIEGLQAIPGVTIYGITDRKRSAQRVPTVSFRLDGVPPQVLARRLGDAGFCVWSGNYYALEFTTRAGLEPEGMVRAGLMHYNLPEEVDRFVTAVRTLAPARLPAAT